MDQINIEPFQPEDTKDAAHVVAVAMRTNPSHVAVFQGHADEEIQRATGVFEILFQNSPGTTLVARQEGKLVGVLRMVQSPFCLGPPPEAAQMLEPIMKKALGDSFSRFNEWFSVWIQNDPKEPHWHLGPNGVLPEVQGQGIATQVLTRLCEQIDTDRIAAYLETDKPENVRLYERFGFKVTSETTEPFGVRTYFMWRPVQ